MRYKIIDKKYRFVSAFDDETGAYVRTGILDEHGRDTGVDPFMASFPHLIDVGVMGHCIHGKTGLCAKAGGGCYQSGTLVERPNMTVEDFRWITQQCRGRCNQLALGGRGDPDQHEHFEELLQISRAAAVEKAAQEAAEYERNWTAEHEAEQLQAMKDNGMEVVETPDLESFQAAVQSVYDAYPQYADYITRIQEALA